MSKHYSIQVIGVLLFLAAVASSVGGVCWNCMPNDLSEEDIEKILAEEFKNNFMKSLGLTSEPVMPKNVTYPPKEIINELFADEDDVIHEEDNGALETVLLQPLNSDSRESNRTSFFEYKIMDKLDSYRIEQVTLWLHVNGNTGLYEVYEKISTLPRRMVFMDRHYGNAREWKKLIFTPNKLWLQNPWRKLRIEIKGTESSVVDKPLLQLNLKRREKRLKKRHSTLTPTATTTDDCHPKKKSLCCRHHRDIPLQKIYDWVFMPLTYRAFTCSGRCAIKHRNNNTWSFFSQVSIPTREPCCVPTAFEPMTVLYIDSSKGLASARLKKMVLKNMIVKSCGCT